MKKNRKHYYMMLVIAGIVTLFLFYIDEGYYNFKWMKSISNWVFFLIYTAALFGGQLLVNQLLFKQQEGWRKTALVSLLGVPLGLFGLLTLLSGSG